MTCTPCQISLWWSIKMDRASGIQHVRFWRANLRDRDHLKELGVDESTILKEILTNRIGWCRLHWCGSGKEQVADTKERGNYLPVPQIGEHFLTSWGTNKFLRGYTPWNYLINQYRREGLNKKNVQYVAPFSDGSHTVQEEWTNQ